MNPAPLVASLRRACSRSCLRRRSDDSDSDKPRWFDMVDPGDARSPSGRLYATGANAETVVGSFATEDLTGFSSKLVDKPEEPLEKPKVPQQTQGCCPIRPNRETARQRVPPRDRGPGGAASAPSPPPSPPPSSPPDRGSFFCPVRFVRPQCQFIIGIIQDSNFNVKGRLIGTGGRNMKDIVEKCGGDTRLRLRGKGSGFKEGPMKQESNDPLMLCVSAPDEWAYSRAKEGVTQLLEGIYAEYAKHRRVTAPRIVLHEGPRED